MQNELRTKKERYQNVFELEYRLGYVERDLRTQEMRTSRRRRFAACLREALEIRNKRICLEIFRRHTTKTEDIYWTIRLHSSLC